MKRCHALEQEVFFIDFVTCPLCGLLLMLYYSRHPKRNVELGAPRPPIPLTLGSLTLLTGLAKKWLRARVYRTSNWSLPGCNRLQPTPGSRPILLASLLCDFLVTSPSIMGKCLYKIVVYMHRVLTHICFLRLGPRPRVKLELALRS